MNFTPIERKISKTFGASSTQESVFSLLNEKKGSFTAVKMKREEREKVDPLRPLCYFP